MKTFILAAALSLSFATPLLAGPMTVGERQRLVAHLEMTEAWLDSEVLGLSQALRGRQFLTASQDLYQWFLMISSHSHRHIMQVREVKAHKGFPKR